MLYFCNSLDVPVNRPDWPGLSPAMLLWQSLQGLASAFIEYRFVCTKRRWNPSPYVSYARLPVRLQTRWTAGIYLVDGGNTSPHNLKVYHFDIIINPLSIRGVTGYTTTKRFCLYLLYIRPKSLIYKGLDRVCYINNRGKWLNWLRLPAVTRQTAYAVVVRIHPCPPVQEKGDCLTSNI